MCDRKNNHLCYRTALKKKTKKKEKKKKIHDTTTSDKPKSSTYDHFAKDTSSLYQKLPESVRH